MPIAFVAVALAFSAFGYLALVGYDYLAFRFVGRPSPWREMLVPSFISFAVSNSAPASVLTAGGVRYRMYPAMGLTVAEAATVAVLNVVTYAAGLCLLAGLVLLAHPMSAGGAGWLKLPSKTLGSLLLLGTAAYLLATRYRRGPVSLFGR